MGQNSVNCAFGGQRRIGDAAESVIQILESLDAESLSLSLSL